MKKNSKKSPRSKNTSSKRSKLAPLSLEDLEIVAGGSPAPFELITVSLN